MAATNFTPISLYYSATASAVPLAANLVAGELALNTNDGKLYYKNSSNVVTLLASNAATTNVSSITFGSTGLTPSTATTGAVTVAGTLATANGGTALTSFTSGGALYATSTSALTTGTLPVASGGTAQTSFTAGRVLYGSFSSSANLFFDSSNNRLGVGTASPAVSLAISATDAILLPNGTTGQRPTGAAGYIRYNSTTGSFEGYTTAWGSIGGGATGAGGDQIFYQNGQTVTTSYTITAGQNAGTFGPVTINASVTVTVPTGSTWSIV